MNREKMKNLVYSVFSDISMIFLALLVIPVVASDFFQLTPDQQLIFSGLDWFIYAFFFLEFVLKVFVADRKSEYIRTHKLDSAISLLIIFSPLLDFVSSVFITVPALRLLRLSRLIRLVAIGGKARREWRKVNLKSYAIVAIVITFGFLTSFFRQSITYTANDITAFTGFIQIIGVLYAITTGFMVLNVWNKYNSIDNAIRKESLSLENIYLMSLQLKQKRISEELRNAIMKYVDRIIEIYWKTKGDIAKTKDDFERFFKTIIKFHAKNQREYLILEDMSEEFRNASSYRSDIVSLISSKTSKILWILLIVLSISLVMGFLLVNFASQLFTTLTITMLSAAIAIISVIIYDMDYPFQAGFWVISPEAYFELEDFLKKY
jgi:hypothetical protein